MEAQVAALLFSSDFSYNGTVGSASSYKSDAIAGFH